MAVIFCLTAPVVRGQQQFQLYAHFADDTARSTSEWVALAVSGVSFDGRVRD